jgi:thiamine-phosphate pyrophosphorylase
MQARHQSWPRIWLMTDERLGERLWAAIDRLPSGAGIVFRHYSLEQAEREQLAMRVAQAARERGLTVAIARNADLAHGAGANLVHNPVQVPSALPFSQAVHSIEQAEQARTAGAALVFVSPVYATRSHPGATPLGPPRAAEIARAAGVPAIALGGMDAKRFADLEGEGFYGWAAIDAWLGAD